MHIHEPLVFSLTSQSSCRYRATTYPDQSCSVLSRPHCISTLSISFFFLPIQPFPLLCPASFQGNQPHYNSHLTISKIRTGWNLTPFTPTNNPPANQPTTVPLLILHFHFVGDQISQDQLVFTCHDTTTLFRCLEIVNRSSRNTLIYFRVYIRFLLRMHMIYKVPSTILGLPALLTINLKSSHLPASFLPMPWNRLLMFWGSIVRLSATLSQIRYITIHRTCNLWSDFCSEYI